MDKIKKLLRKISKRDNEILLEAIRLVRSGEWAGLSVKKLQGSDFYRARKGHFRIIFHCDFLKKFVVDSVKLRDEKTYK